MANLVIARGTGNITNAQIFFDKDNDLYILDANKAPLVALTAKLRKKETVSPKFSWFEDTYNAAYDQVNYSTGYADTATTIQVDNITYFMVNDVVKVARTGEVMLVTAKGTDVIQVLRGFGETSAAAIVDNDYLWILGSAYEEGAASQEANSTNASEVYNYTQIFRTPFEVTETLANTKLYTGNDLSTQQKKKGVDHSQAIERAFFFGERKEYTSGTHPRRMTRGLLKFISTNVTDVGGTITEAEFETFLRSGMRYGSKEKWLFASRLLVSAISSWANGKLDMVPSDKTYGIAITRYVSPHGVVNIIPHDMLEGTGGTDEEYGGYGFLIDPESVSYRPLSGRDTRMKMNIQAADEDSRKGEFITEAGLQLINEKTCAVIKAVFQY